MINQNYNKIYHLICEDVRRGRLHSWGTIKSYDEYRPLDIIEDVRQDSCDKGIPRMMCNLCMLYGNIDKSGRFEVARQHKFTAPQTFIRYVIKVILL